MKKIMYDANRLADIQKSLQSVYGVQGWWHAGTAFEVMMGAVLTQNTSWTNAQESLESLGRELTPQEIIEMPIEEIVRKIKKSGYFNQKAQRLQTLAQWYIDGGGDVSAFAHISTEVLREMLLAVNGIGFETADSILLYAFHRPVFVVDAYTRRLFDRLGFEVPRAYEDFARCFYEALEQDEELYAQYHGLIVEHAKRLCLKKSPLCQKCPLAAFCAFAIDNVSKIV